MLWLFRPSYSSGGVVPPDSAIPDNGTNDSNAAFTPFVPKKKKEDIPFYPIEVVSEEKEKVDTDRILEEILNPVINQVKVKLSEIEEEVVDSVVSNKINEINEFLDSPRVVTAFTKISKLEAKKQKERIQYLVDSTISRIKLNRISNKLEAVAEQSEGVNTLLDSEIARHNAILAEKTSQLERLNSRIEQLKNAQKLKKQLEDEEEFALMYLLLDS